MIEQIIELKPGVHVRIGSIESVEYGNDPSVLEVRTVSGAVHQLQCVTYGAAERAMISLVKAMEAGDRT